MHQSAGCGRSHALWYIDVDVSAETHCRQGVYIGRTDEVGAALPNESDVLFAPYSVFTLIAAHWKRGDGVDPHIFHLKAAVDNRGTAMSGVDQVRHLPLAPWY